MSFDLRYDPKAQTVMYGKLAVYLGNNTSARLPSDGAARRQLAALGLTLLPNNAIVSRRAPIVVSKKA